jgi:hypothetical protein
MISIEPVFSPMPHTVTVYDHFQLSSAIQDHGLNVGDIVHFVPENQMGEAKYKVVLNHSGAKSLKLIWDAEIGTLENVNNVMNNHMNHMDDEDDEKYMEDDYKEDAMGGARKGKKSRKAKKGGKAKKSRKAKKGGKAKKSRKAKKGGKAKKSRKAHRRARHTRRATR